ncbi:hypothetical protein FGO68_gene2114 [Halteria grandinella]|uniref:Uncharacterized protein n=1 Tax=Halteria grandinella TaxID=5974 RepID=A0A8J8NPB6_HALGN|nr:hypothetical protein FGO68_gene2114 [Halteria grandinella]
MAYIKREGLPSNQAVELAGMKAWTSLKATVVSILAVEKSAVHSVGIEVVEQVKSGDVEILLVSCGEESDVLLEDVVADSVCDREDGVEEPGDGLGACGELLDEQGVLAGGVLVGGLDNDVVQLHGEASKVGGEVSE